jgi:hypothetical protein
VGRGRKGKRKEREEISRGQGDKRVMGVGIAVGDRVDGVGGALPLPAEHDFHTTGR